MAHEECANVVPEAWVDEIELDTTPPGGTQTKEKVVMGIDAIVKDRWNLVSYHTAAANCGFLTIHSTVEMHGVQQDATEGAWCTYTVHKRQVPEGVPCVMCKGWFHPEHRLHRLEGG